MTHRGSLRPDHSAITVFLVAGVSNIDACTLAITTALEMKNVKEIVGRYQVLLLINMLLTVSILFTAECILFYVF